MIRFACPLCRKVYRAADDQAGRQAACKRCGAVMLVPESPDAPPDDDPDPDLPATGAAGGEPRVSIGDFKLTAWLLLACVAVFAAFWLFWQFVHADPTTQRTIIHGVGRVVLVVLGVVVLAAVISVLWAVSQKCCPFCHWPVDEPVGETVVTRKKCFGLVVRTAYTTRSGSGWVYGSKNLGMVSTTTQATTQWGERVPVVRTTFERHYVCRHCGRDWPEQYTEEVEDFEPNDPLPPG